METSHVFRGPDYLCEQCQRPRALHVKDGFIPSKAPLAVTMDLAARYGPHPRWFRPGTLRLNREEQAQMDRIFSKRAKNIQSHFQGSGVAHNHPPAIILRRQIAE